MCEDTHLNMNHGTWCRGLTLADNKGLHGRSIVPPPTGVGRRMKKKRKINGSESGQFNRTANEADSNNNNTDKKNIQNKQNNAQSNTHNNKTKIMICKNSQNAVK